VGESGSGKSTLGLTILRLVEPTSGAIIFDGQEITRISQSKLRGIRKHMQIVFQDPSSSLDPRKRVADTVSEPLRSSDLDKSVLQERISEALEQVGLDPSQADLLPHQFSGGQRQRISIARAIIPRPKLIVLDEPTSSLDASVQSQILLLLEKLQSRFGLSYLLITHNMSVARYLADRIAVMYLGTIFEIGTNQQIIETPLHPYTQVLISSVLEPQVHAKLRKIQLEGEIPSPINPPQGCRFNTRCPFAKQICQSVKPELREMGIGHFVACHFAGEVDYQEIISRNSANDN
jgi:oligopeptide transport system ATP-binding protein